MVRFGKISGSTNHCMKDRVFSLFLIYCPAFSALPFSSSLTKMRNDGNRTFPPHCCMQISGSDNSQGPTDRASRASCIAVTKRGGGIEMGQRSSRAIASLYRVPYFEFPWESFVLHRIRLFSSRLRSRSLIRKCVHSGKFGMCTKMAVPYVNLRN